MLYANIPVEAGQDLQIRVLFHLDGKEIEPNENFAPVQLSQWENDRPELSGKIKANIEQKKTSENR